MGMIIFLPLISAFLVVFILIWIICLIVKFILYIFQSFGLLRISKKEKYKFPYIVWIPAISHYVLGRYCMDKVRSIIYCILTLIKIITLYILLTTTNNILFYISIGYIIFYFIIDMLVMNKFYKKVYKKPELFTILTIITFGLLKPIFIYISRIRKISKVEL